MAGSGDSLVQGIQEKLSGQQPYARFPDRDSSRDGEGQKARRRSKLLTVAPFILGARHCPAPVPLLLPKTLGLK